MDTSEHEDILAFPGKRRPELLAPAGEWTALEAALEAGADAVYIGLTTLNARRRARNFRPEELPRAVEAAHARGVRVYLTLNIDLAQRELGQAARMLEHARQAKVDAVLVRDPALLALRPEFAELEFHFSTQTCMANSADLAAASHFGADRVVLAREMSLAEIKAASRVPGIETEVFVQGALCFSVSGRCLMSSWVGGRSGNRGTCTSPCRVPWTVAEGKAGTPLSMLDLSAVLRVGELGRANVAALKIEGRLKTAQWVRRAVALYRRALDGPGEDPEGLQEQARQLGAYTGREMSSAYLDGQRHGLTGVASRPSADPQPETSAETLRDAETEEDLAQREEADEQALLPTFDLDVDLTERGVCFRFASGTYTSEWTIPRTVVRRAHKAVTIGQLLEWLGTQQVNGHRLEKSATNAAEFLLVPRAVNALMDRLSGEVRLACKAPDDRVRADLPPRVRAILAACESHSANRRPLGSRPDRVRLEAAAVSSFLKQVQPSGVIVEGLTAKTLDKLRAVCARVPLVVALPPVFFEDELRAIRALVRACAEARVPVEVNTWGGWWLAKQEGARMEGGPGLGVLNGLAARVLAEAGMESVTLSIEADRRQWEDLAAQCPAPCSLVVFGRPPLATSRAELSEDFLNQPFADRRGVEMAPRRERGLWVFRPVEPFDLRGTENDRIRVAHLVVDLVGSAEPLADWYDQPEPRSAFRFNYDRSLA